MKRNWLSALLCISISFVFAIPSVALAHHYKKKPNFIVILMDDYGKDAFSLLNPTTEDGSINAPVPSLGALAKHGVIFKNGWAMPTCSVTRGTRTMGLLPSTTGLGRVIGQFTPRFGAPGPFAGIEHPPTMIDPSNKNLIQQIMRDAGYTTLKLGKWHETIAGIPGTDPGTDIPDVTNDIVESGFDHFFGFAAGTIVNHGGTAVPRGGDYDLLFTTIDGNGVRDTGTVTTNEFTASFLVGRAIDFIKNQKKHKPYYIALDFAAPHWVFGGPFSDGYQVAPGPNEPAPTTNPFGPVTDWRTLTDVGGYASVIDDVETAWGGSYPDAGTVSGLPTPMNLNQRARAIAAFKSKVAYMDLQIGRLLEHVDKKDTYILILGDNGTQGGNPTIDVIQAPYDTARSKGTLYRNGVEVPYIISGPYIHKPGRISDALITSNDVLATVTHIAGIKQPRETRRQSISAVPALLGYHGWRRYNVAEGFNTQASVGGRSPGPATTDGRVVADKRFRLIARPVVETIAGPPPGPQGDSTAFMCRESFVPAGNNDPLDAECLNQTTGIYEKEYELEFYDIKNDEFEDDALVKEEMSKFQWYAFKRLCREQNKISRKATYFQNGKVCKMTGEDLIDIDPPVVP